ncbi:allograft inflammatory factor 1-like [Pyxicephalus adspersus]|uniref:allograft inflammatory factor 1-like n=1 Tax=Pyxicephalus adspersus TaxID=30357 RepID=UPI003B5A120D
MSEEQREKLEMNINLINKEYIGDVPFKDITNLAIKLEKLKRLFMKYDYSSGGEIDYTAFHALARELRVFTTLAELKKRVQEITGSTRNILSYEDCAMAMLGRRSTMCQRKMRNHGEDGDFDKKACWLDCTHASYFGYLEFSIPSPLNSPITPLPPPPPPSPADMFPGEKVESYPAA